MPNPKKENAGKGSVLKVSDGQAETTQASVFDCSAQNITAVCQELEQHGISLRDASGATQLDTLRRALEFRGGRGLNTYEGTAAGYLRVATRVKELKEVWEICSIREDVVGPDGLLHKGVARYVLLGRKTLLPVQSELDFGAG